MRLQKYMAKCGVASRRKSEKLISKGVVKVNGSTITELGFKINPDKDIVKVNNRIIKMEEKSVYILLNKPDGYITTVSDQFDRPTVLDIIKNVKQRVYPVGRLDYDTSGLLLITNDGNLTYKLTHPKHEINKTYIAKIKGIPKENELTKFRNGLKIENYITSKAKIKILNRYKDSSLVEIIIHEGKNRQVRKMCDKIGHPVIWLKRIALGKITIDNLEKGKWRYLNDKEINYLKNI
ncbi:MAG: rRNA pseudouridine synthase [Firmicutes bacterium]|nr:rRNA pseudouridine synthase [Bacillota bacterium]